MYKGLKRKKKKKDTPLLIPPPPPVYSPFSSQVKLTSTRSYMDAVASHLEIARYMSPGSLAESSDDFEVKGNVMIHPSATIGKG